MKKSLALAVLVLLVSPALFAEEEPSVESPSVEVAAARPSMVDRALSWIGVKYRFGGQDEKKGFDCAGLVRRVFGTVAVELPRTAAAQFRYGCVVPREELQPGDLVFFRNTYKPGISHVGIYIGGGEFVHAANRRRSVVVDRLASPYFDRRFAGGRRIVPPTVVVPPVPTLAPAETTASLTK